MGYNSGSISNSYAAGTVSNTGLSFTSLGGLVGDNEGSISNSYAAGEPTGDDDQGLGGLVGWNRSSGSISNSYAAGEGIHGDSVFGGLVGQNEGSISGINYFADDIGGPDGVGGGTSCGSMVCVQATGGDDAARAAWLADSLDETDDGGLNWDAELDAEGNAVWGNLNAAGFPCLKDMPAGAEPCS